MENWSFLNLYTTNPAWNLAAEQYVFDCLSKERSYVILWQNDRSVIIGKYQNTLAEINQSYIEKHGIQVVRRLSGRGAVYHDLGNLNFTIITDAEVTENLDLHLFCQPVVEALKTLGVPAELNGRNDMTIEGKKFSWNAQYIRNRRIMHHGTIMFESDLSALSNALRVDESKIQTKGIKSVRSRVTSIRPYLPMACDLETFRAKLLEQLRQNMPGDDYTFDEQDQKQIQSIREERYDTWEWNYGKSPECDIQKRERFEGCGLVEAWISVRCGIITEIFFTGDFFSSEDPMILAKAMVGLHAEREACRAFVKTVNVSRYFNGLKAEDFLKLLSD